MAENSRSLAMDSVTELLNNNRPLTAADLNSKNKIGRFKIIQ